MPTKKKPEPEPDHCHGTRIEGCHLVGVQWDAKAVEAISEIARAIHAGNMAALHNAIAIETNADSLVKLSEVLRASNVHIESMIKIEGVH